MKKTLPNLNLKKIGVCWTVQLFLLVIDVCLAPEGTGGLLIYRFFIKYPTLFGGIVLIFLSITPLENYVTLRRNLKRKRRKIRIT